MNLDREKRIDSILSSLKTLDYLTRSQIQKLHDLGGDRNARRVMDSLSEYVAHFRDRENVYYLNKYGRERVGTDVVRTKISPVTHYIMRNDLYIFKKPQTFKTEQRLRVGDKLTVVADAFMKANDLLQLVEIDHTQSMVKNETKMSRYKELKASGAFQNKYGYFPRLIWVTCSETRRKRLKELSEGLDVTVYLWEEIK